MFNTPFLKINLKNYTGNQKGYRKTQQHHQSTVSNRYYIYRTPHSTTVEYTFLSSAHRHIPR